MTNILCLTFRFIQPFPLFHGSADAGMPEWPPSPLRAFQALLNAAGMRYRGRPIDSDVRSSLSTLEAIRPHIVAPQAQPATVGYRAYVPHNQADLVAAAWDRGNLDASIASHRMEKDVRPMRINVTDDTIPAVHYLYSLDLPNDACRRLLEFIRPSVRSITALGWGIDQVVADATLIAQSDFAALEGQQWRPASTGGHRLRIHRAGSLDALSTRHEKFLKRLVDGDFTPVPPITAMDVVHYRRDSDPTPRPHAVFKLVDENDDAFRYPHAKLIHIAGMVRHAALERIDPAKGNPPPWIKDPAEWVNRVVRGKRDESGGDNHQQFSYIPLASIGHEHSDALIRNIMVTAPLGMERELDYLAEQLDGQVLKPEGTAESCKTDSTAKLSRRIELQKFVPPRGKFIAERYLGTSTTWQTVTPVILDGHVKKWKERDKDGREVTLTDHAKWIGKALQRAGIETPCEFEWQAFPFFKNCLSAHKYDRDQRHTGYYRPNHLETFTAVHVCIRFGHRQTPGDINSSWLPLEVPGPLAIGAGRHCGLGVFAAQMK